MTDTELNEVTRLASQLGAWEFMARQAGAIDEVRSCRSTEPEDVLRLITTLRGWLEEEKQRNRALHSKLGTIRAYVEHWTDEP